MTYSHPDALLAPPYLEVMFRESRSQVYLAPCMFEHDIDELSLFFEVGMSIALSGWDGFHGARVIQSWANILTLLSPHK